jgi:SSS family transporter
LGWILEHWLAVTLLIVYTGVLMHHAKVGRERSTGMDGYYVGGRDMGGFAVGVSFFATYASTNSYIGNAGKGYEYGLPWMLLGVFMVLFTFLSWTFVAPRMRRFAAHWDALTMPDYLSERFGARSKTLRVTSALVIVFSSLLYLLAVFKGAGNLFQQFLSIPYEAAVGGTLVVVMFYTSIGGFVSVVRTDVVQGFLMILGSLLIFYFVTDAAGGIGVLPSLAERPDTANLFEASGAIPFVVLLGITLSGTLKLLVDPRQVSRFYALKDEKSVRLGIWVAVIGITLVMAFLLPVGLYARFLLDGVTDTDLVVPMLVSDPDIFPLWASDFLAIAMLAAAMSSMDSVLLVAASVLYNDVAGALRPAARPLQWTRAGVVGFAILAAVLALNPPGGIVEITVFSGSLYAVCFFPAIVFGLHWRGGSAQAVLASIFVGIPVLLTWILSGLDRQVHEVFPALAASSLTYLIVARFTTPGRERLPEAADA